MKSDKLAGDDRHAALRTGAARSSAGTPTVPPVQVSMLVKNSFEFDARVTKEAESLVQAGYRVRVVALQAPGATPRAERTDAGVEVVRVPRIYGRLARLTTASTTTPGVSSQRDAGATRAPRRALARLLTRALPLVGGPLRLLNTVVIDHRMTRAAAQVAPAVVHAHDLNTLRAARRVRRRTGARLVYDAHELHTHRSGMGPGRRLVAGAAERHHIRVVDECITTTESWAEHLRARYSIPRPTVVRNVPPLSTPRAWDLHARTGVPEGTRLLVYQGSIQRHRGLLPAIEALDRLPECALVIVGYGAYRPTLEAHVTAHGLDDRVRFFGPVPYGDLLRYTAGADIGLCCIENSSLSYYSSLPNKLFEYAMAGIPSVTSDFPEMGGFVQREGVGEVCDPHDPADIARAVRRILDDPVHARELGRAARIAARRHNWTLEQRRLLAAYGRLPLHDRTPGTPHVA